MSTITPLPPPPTSADPANFNDRADDFIGQLPVFVTETNIVALELLMYRDEVAVNKDISNQARDGAVAASITAQVQAVKWVTDSMYLEGAVTWSPITYLTYRKITVGSSTGGTIDPSLNSSIWLPIVNYIPDFVLINFGVI